MATQFRQHPGVACEECRRRKARCDRTRPRCGTCSVLDKLCVFNEHRTQRGPKKGQIRALRERVNSLERLLAEPQHVEGPFDSAVLEAPEIPTDTQPFWGFDANLSLPLDPLLAEMAPFPTHSSSSPDSSWRGGHSSSEDHDSALVRDDLVAVYFERVHPNVPMIHKLRYFDVLERQCPSESQRCLQLAVQAIAAASTAQTLKSSHSLYTEACTALDTIEISGPIGRAQGTPVELEYIQALLLLVHYEALRMPQQKYVLTAGRVFRLVQIARLHEIDINASPNDGSPGADFARDEERRRTFWAAYILDRLLSVRHDLPITLHDLATHTRLPAPEANFEDCTPTVMPFLCDVMCSPGATVLPVFTECIVLAALQGRVMTLWGTPPDRLRNVGAKLQDIRVCLHNRLQIILCQFPKPSATVDSALAFTYIMAYTLVVNLDELAEGMAFAMDEQQMFATRSPTGAVDAYNEIMSLARSSCRMSRFKTNLFLPVLLAQAIRFIRTHKNGQTEELISILKILSSVNRVAEDLLDEIRVQM